MRCAVAFAVDCLCNANARARARGAVPAAHAPRRLEASKPVGTFDGCVLHAGGTVTCNTGWCCAGCVDGSLSMLVPLDEQTFKRLDALQKLMTLALPHHAGLNP